MDEIYRVPLTRKSVEFTFQKNNFHSQRIKFYSPRSKTTIYSLHPSSLMYSATLLIFLFFLTLGFFTSPTYMP